MTTPRGGLPPIQFIETDASVIERTLVERYEQFTGVTLTPADPTRLFLGGIAAAFVATANAYQIAGEQNFVATATGAFLDGLGAFVGVSRLPAQKAKTRVQFVGNVPVGGSAVIIPEGTLLAAGGVVFKTLSYTKVYPGDPNPSEPIVAEAVDAGVSANGLAPGAVNVIVNPIAYVASVTSLDVTAGGSDVESDDAYAERIIHGTDTYIVAGPRKAYEALTRQAIAGIQDVSVSNPSPGVVDVRVIMGGGAVPTSSQINDIKAYLSADTRRPLTDDVQVSAPTPVGFSGGIKWWIKTIALPRITQVQSDVSSAVSEYSAWQTGKIGRDIVGAELIRRVMEVDGVKRVELTSWIPGDFFGVDADEIASLSAPITINLEGAEDD